jgi:hypothetical protein
MSGKRGEELPPIDRNRRARRKRRKKEERREERGGTRCTTNAPTHV